MKNMNFQIVILTLLIFFVVSQNSAFNCHYSCATCVGSSYTLCLKCNDGQNITVLEDPLLSQSEFINSNQQSGICIMPLSPRVNELGILLFLICSGIAILVRTN